MQRYSNRTSASLSGLSQGSRHGVYGQGLGRKRSDLQAQRGLGLGVVFGGGDFLRRGGKSHRDQQRLAADAGIGQVGPLAFDPFVNDALMGGSPKCMLILGGSIIGLEMGTVYSTLGARLDVVEMLDGLMQGADRDLVKI